MTEITAKPKYACPSIGGNYPKRWIKITLAVFVAVVIIAMMLLAPGVFQQGR